MAIGREEPSRDPVGRIDALNVVGCGRRCEGDSGSSCDWKDLLVEERKKERDGCDEEEKG